MFSGSLCRSTRLSRRILIIAGLVLGVGRLAFATEGESASRSVEEDYTIPEAGASWLASTDTGPNAGFAIRLKNASLTIEGFSELGCLDGSMIVVGSGSTLNVADCHFEGTTQTDTAAIDTGPMGQSISTSTPESHVTINVANSRFDGNARGILTRSTQGLTRLSITSTHFSNNSAWPIEYRVGAGDHELSVADSSLQWALNTPVRLYAFHNVNPALATSYRANFDRVRFTLSGAARAALVMGGVETVSNAASDWNLRVTNSVFDLRSAGAFADTSALNALPETTRRGSALFEHCTIVIGNAAHAGILWRGGTANVFTILNSIIDGAGTAISNTGTGSVTSGINLFNTTTAVTGSGGATLSGQEIIGQSPLFVDRTAGDFHLQPESPAAGVGQDLGIQMDHDGFTRPNPVGSLPDLGAFEVAGVSVPPALGDINEDGMVNVADVTLFAHLIGIGSAPANELGDINNDGVVDDQDVEALAWMIVNQP
jgi:hypothetical protein